MLSESELDEACRKYRASKKYKVAAFFWSRLIPWLKLDTFADFASSESRWEFAAICFGLSLFGFSLFPAFYAFGVSPDGGFKVTPFVIAAWAFLILGLTGLALTGLLVIYYKGNPKRIDTTAIELAKLQGQMAQLSKLDELSKLDKLDTVIDRLDKLITITEARNGKPKP